MFKTKRIKQLEARRDYLEEMVTQKVRQYESLEEKYNNLEQKNLEASAEKEQKEIEKHFKCGETVTYLETRYVILAIGKEFSTFYSHGLTGKAIIRTQYRNRMDLVNHIFSFTALPALIAENKKPEKAKE